MRFCDERQAPDDGNGIHTHEVFTILPLSMHCALSVDTINIYRRIFSASSVFFVCICPAVEVAEQLLPCSAQCISIYNATYHIIIYTSCGSTTIRNISSSQTPHYEWYIYRISTPNEVRTCDISRSLESWGWTIKSVVLTADFFYFVVKPFAPSGFESCNTKFGRVLCSLGRLSWSLTKSVSRVQFSTSAHTRTRRDFFAH